MSGEREAFEGPMGTPDMAASVEHAIKTAYERYDADPRVSGVDDWEAFRDALVGVFAAHAAAIVGEGT